MNFQLDVFNRATIYRTLFFNIKTVLEYPNLTELELHKPELYAGFKELMNSDDYYGQDDSIEGLYQRFGIKYPEFIKIVTISYCIVTMNDEGKMVRDMRKHTGYNEAIVLESFFDYLQQYDSDEFKGLMLCGFNLAADIQTIIKRFFVNKKEFVTINTLPNLFKHTLGTKPWDSNIIDINQIWKFSAYTTSDLPSFSLISDFCELRKNTSLMSNYDLSKYYWKNIDESPDKVFKDIELQSINQTNMYIQLMNELRTF